VLGVAWLVSAGSVAPFLVYWETALQSDVPADLLAPVISLDWMCSFAFMPVGLALVGPAVDALGRDAVLWVGSSSPPCPPLLCLRVPGMLSLRRRGVSPAA
jgi:hypothetical protein